MNKTYFKNRAYSDIDKRVTKDKFGDNLESFCENIACLLEIDRYTLVYNTFTVSKDLGIGHDSVIMSIDRFFDFDLDKGDDRFIPLYNKKGFKYYGLTRKGLEELLDFLLFIQDIPVD